MLGNILITGGSGFIGSNFVRYLFEKTDFTGTVINLDKLTYAGNPLNLTDIEKQYGDNRYFFCQGDINDTELVKQIFREHNVDTVVHFAAESHVDRSIFGPMEFVTTNVNGTVTLLEIARAERKDRADVRFHQDRQ